MKLLLSEKGKDFNGNLLDEDNVLSNQYVLYRKVIYQTGNRRHQCVELFDRHGHHACNVLMSSIRLIKYSDK